MKRRKALKKIEKALSVNDEITNILADRIENGNYLIQHLLRGQPRAKEITQAEFDRLDCNIILDDIIKKTFFLSNMKSENIVQQKINFGFYLKKLEESNDIIFIKKSQCEN